MIKNEVLKDLKFDLQLDENRMFLDENKNTLNIDYGGSGNLDEVTEAIDNIIEEYTYVREDIMDNPLIFIIDTGMESVKVSFKY